LVLVHFSKSTSPYRNTQIMLSLYTHYSGIFQEIDFKFDYDRFTLKTFAFQVVDQVRYEPMCVELFEAAKLSKADHIAV
jgi:hypothetical protein